MKNKWNDRYKEDEYFFGKAPNEFLEEEINKLKPGKALFIGDGEGRNSVYASTLGWDVEAFDVSEIGKGKAERLANENNVQINYFLADAFEHDYAPSCYDLIALVYFHVERKNRDLFNQKILNSLKDNGTLILLVYDEDHLKHNSDGPSDINLLYNLSDIAENYIDLEFMRFSKEQISRAKNAKTQHATVIKFVGKK